MLCKSNCRLSMKNYSDIGGFDFYMDTYICLSVFSFLVFGGSNFYMDTYIHLLKS
jgi:hypothetical protein